MKFLFILLTAQPIQSGITKMNAVANHSGLYCQYILINRALSIIFQTASSRLHVLLSVKNNATDRQKDYSVWSEDLSHQGFRACVFVHNGSLHDDLLQLPSVHWSVFSKELFPLKDTDEVRSAVKIGAEYLDTWSTGIHCQNIFNNSSTNTSSSSIKYNVFTSIELNSKNASLVGYKNALTVWTEVIVEEKDLVRMKHVRVCVRDLQNRDIVHHRVVVVSIELNLT